MTNRQIERMDTGKGIGKVSRLPDFLLTIKGRFDSASTNPGVADAVIEKMNAKCAALEKKEALKTIKRTEQIRRDAHQAAITIKRNYKTNDLPPIRSEVGILAPYEVRENLTRESANRAKKAETDMAVKTLADKCDELEHAESVLRQRIERTRSKSLYSKVNAYVLGIRKGGLPDYKPPQHQDNKAYEEYKNSRDESDELIFSLLSQIRKGEITV